MITKKTVSHHIADQASTAKHWVLQSSARLGAVILLTFILGVFTIASLKCGCGGWIWESHERNHVFDQAFTLQSGPSFAPNAPAFRITSLQDEDEVLEDGTLTQAQGYAADVIWRWDERPHREVLNGWHQTYGSRDHRTDAFHYRLAALSDRTSAHAPGLLVLPHNQVTQRNNTTQVFYAREVDELSRELGARFDMVFEVSGETAYLAYFPREEGIGVEVYAVDLRTNSPLWRTTVRSVDIHAEDMRTRVQLHVARGRLHVMTREGDLRRIDELSVKTGEIMSLQEVPFAQTLSPPRESMRDGAFSQCTFTQRVGDKDTRACSTSPSPALQVVRERLNSEVMWRLSLLGDQLSFFPLERVHANPTSDVILSHDSEAPGSVVTAIDHDSGEVLWTTGIQVTSEETLTHKHVEVNVLKIQDELTLVVYTEENDEAYTVYLDPMKGQVRSILRMSR